MKTEDSLPTFKDLYGMAPNCTKGIPAEDFIALVREKKMKNLDIAMQEIEDAS